MYTFNQLTMSTSLFLHVVEEVTSGNVKVSLNYGTIPVVDETLDLCDLVTQVDKQCPLQKGPFPLKITANIPDYVPTVSNLFIVKSHEVLTLNICIHMSMCRVSTKAKLLLLIRMERNWHVWMLT